MDVFFSGLYPSEPDVNFKFATVLSGRILSIQLKEVNGGKISKNVALVKVRHLASGLAPFEGKQAESGRVIPVSPEALHTDLDGALRDAGRNYATYRERMEADFETIKALLEQNAGHLAGLNLFEVQGLVGG
jgi:hypothetical protein